MVNMEIKFYYKGKLNYKDINFYLNNLLCMSLIIIINLML